MNALFCALDKKEFHRVSSCESANEIWHKLEVVYEGTNQVKESKVSRYTRQYELFQMEQNESVYSMYTRFTDIVNTLGALGKTFSNNLAAEKGHGEKKKNIALKASKYESDGESEPDDEELAMLAKRFRKFFKKTGERRKFKNFKNSREKKEVITCYECKKPGHIRLECPLINKLKKKAMVATWNDSDEDSSDEEESQEVSNLALMAIGDDDDLNEGMKKKKNKWYLDNGCSRHMTGNYAWFSSFTKIENGGDVSFGDNSKGKILGIVNVSKVSSTLIENVCFVENLNHNLISISQLCDKGYKVVFDKFSCVIENSCDGKILFVGNRCDNLGKFDPKFDVGIFLGYSNSSKAYRVYNKRTLVVEESMHVTFDESNPSSTEKGIIYDDADGELQEESSKHKQENAPQRNQEDGQVEQTNMEQHEGTSQTLPKEWRPPNSILHSPLIPKSIFFVQTLFSQNPPFSLFFTMAEPSRRTRTRKDTPQRNPIPPRAVSEFERIHFPTPSLAKRFEDRFNGRKVLDSFCVDIEDFRTLIVYVRSVRNMLHPWESAIDFDDRVYPNLVRVFYSNMEIFETRLDRIVTQVGGVHIEFDVELLNNILGISNDGHRIYTSRKALFFSTFSHHRGVRNICRRRDLTYDICNLAFWSQLLPLQVRILHFILQHIITLRKGHSDEVIRLDVGLLDSLITGRPINLGYIIVRHMLSIPAVNHRLLPYGSIIIKILRRFEWIKTSTSKNRDTLIAPEDDHMLNDVYRPDQLPNFRLGPHPPPPHRRSIPQPPADSDTEEHEMDVDIPSTLMPHPAPAQPSAPEPSTVPAQHSASEPPPAPEQPPASVQPLLRMLCSSWRMMFAGFRRGNN
ncbi:hypothetical protein KPL70_007924 [Citrus sinensis]|nr:hypothetical protein KPL70_007924 [Citrus sinensis]